MRARRIARPGFQFRDLKYKHLGINSPPKPEFVAEPPAKWSEMDTIHYLRQTRALAHAIITELSSMSDLSLPPAEIEPIGTEMAKLDGSLLKYAANGFPAVVPPYSANSLIEKLVRYKYAPQDFQLLKNWVYGWLNAKNMRTDLSVTGYNYLVGFALHANDVGLALHACEIMRARKCWPNRQTLHLFLSHNAKQIDANPYPRPNMGHPLVNTHLCLKKMRALDVRADRLTWNLVMQCMPFGFGKSFVLEEMDRRSIALENSAKQSLLNTIVSDREQPGHLSTDIFRYIDSLDVSDPVVLQSVADHLLVQKSANNANVVDAWHWLRNSAQRSTSLAMLHVFLRRFAHRKRLDWQLGVLSAFCEVKWDSLVWEYLLEAASFMKNNSMKPMALGTILQQAQRENVVLTVRSRYLARRAVRTYSLRDMGAPNWQTTLKGLEWIDALCPKQPELLGAIGYSDQGTVFSGEPTQLDLTRFEAMPRTDSWARRCELARALK